MSLHAPAPTTVPRCPEAGAVPARGRIRRSAGALPHLVCRLLFWLLAVGMASELPLGSSWPESSRTARAIDLRDSLLTASPEIPNDDDGGDHDPELAQAPPDLGDQAGLPRLERLPSSRLASILHGDSFEAAPARPPYARASARAPPFLKLG